MKKYLMTILGGVSLCAAQLDAQVAQLGKDEILAAQDKQVLDRQAAEFYQQLDAMAARLPASVVQVQRGDSLLCHGTVIAPGRVLTKWSDLSLAAGPLIVKHAGKLHDARLLGGYAQHDVALLEVPNLTATAVQFARDAKLSKGDFIFTLGANQKAGEFGVVSVEQRSLRDEDLPYLGLIGELDWKGEGVLVASVDSGSKALSSGLQPGDIIKQVAEQKVNSIEGLRQAMRGHKPGDQLAMVVQRGDQLYQTKIELGSRPPQPVVETQRLAAMNAMGNRLSLRRDKFASVVQSDMRIEPSSAGRLVYDLQSRPVGVALSRAGRIESYVLPAETIVELLQTQPDLASQQLERNIREQAMIDVPKRPRQRIDRRSLEQLQALETLQMLEDAMREIRRQQQSLQQP